MAMKQTVEEAAQAADVKMAEPIASYRNSPEGKLRQDKEALARMQQGHFRHDNAATEARLERQIAAGERAAAQASMPAVLTDAQRIDRIVAGVPLPTGPEVTSEGQLSTADFNAAVADLLDRGVRPELVATFLATGRSDAERGHEIAQRWFKRLETDTEMQKKLLAGDSELNRELTAASIYMVGRNS
jgi:hypothetical protein